MSIAREEFDRLVAEYDLTEWRLEVSNRMTSAAGWCYHKQKVIRLSDWLVTRASKREVLDTVRHEIAHAIAGDKAGHGPEWKQIASSLGARPKPHYSEATAQLNDRRRR